MAQDSAQLQGTSDTRGRLKGGFSVRCALCCSRYVAHSVDVLAEMEETERRVLHNVLSVPWEQSADDVTRWEELLEHAAQTRIRLQQAREERLERERGVG